MKIGFNKEEVKKMTKEQFLDNQKHHADDVDLEAEYHKIVPKGEDKKAKESK